MSGRKLVSVGHCGVTLSCGKFPPKFAQASAVATDNRELFSAGTPYVVMRLVCLSEKDGLLFGIAFGLSLDFL